MESQILLQVAGVFIMMFELEKQKKGCNFLFSLSGNRSVLFYDKLDTSLKYDD